MRGYVRDVTMALDVLCYTPRMTSAREQRGINKRCEGATLFWCGKPATHTLVNPAGDVFGCCDSCKDEFENKIFPRMIIDMQDKYCVDCDHVLDISKKNFQYDQDMVCMKCHEKRVLAIFQLGKE